MKWLWPVLGLLVVGSGAVAYYEWKKKGQAQAPSLPPREPQNGTHPLLTVVPTDPHSTVMVEEEHDPDWEVVYASMFFEHPDIQSASIRPAKVGELLWESHLSPVHLGWRAITLDYGVEGWIEEQYIRPFRKTRATGSSAFFPGV